MVSEVEKAKHFEPKLSTFTIACTGPRNALLQKKARLITQAHEQQGLFSVHVWYWDDILERINDYPSVIALHFPYFRPLHTFSNLQSAQPACDERAASETSSYDPSVSLAFAQPNPGKHMLEREPLTRMLEKLLADECSVYLSAPSGYSKSVLLSQLRLPNAAWIDCKDDYREFADFRRHLGRLMRAKYPGCIIPDTPRELARALEDSVSKSQDPRLIIAIDDVNGVDHGVKTFLTELIIWAKSVRLIIAGSTFRLKQQHALEIEGRIRIISASSLAFQEQETAAVLTAPLKSSGAGPSNEFAGFIHDLTHGWPIAVQLVRARLEKEPDESAVVRSLQTLGKEELGSYLLESYWKTLDGSFKSLLITTAIFRLFDRSDAQALLSGQDLEVVWDQLNSLPFIAHLADSFLEYQPLFRAFLMERLAMERTAEEVQRLHHSAAMHFLAAKRVPPAAWHHAQLSGDSVLTVRAAGDMAEYAFSIGNYEIMAHLLDGISPTLRWDDPALSLYQGRLYEHRQDLQNALKWYQRAQTLFEDEGSEFWRIGIISDIGGILRKTGKADQAIFLYDAALAKLQSEGPSEERAKLLANRANALLHQESFDAAEKGYLEAKEIFALRRDTRSMGLVYNGLAQLALGRKNPVDASRLQLKALGCFKRVRDADLFLSVAFPLGQRLLDDGNHRLAYRVYEEAVNMSLASDLVERLPLLLNNLGLTCAFLPEPEPKGVGALLAALNMKRVAGMRHAGTLQNLTTLLIRLGEFERALPFAREQVQAAEEVKDQEVATDGRTRVAELQAFLRTGGAPSKAESEHSKYYDGVRRMITEGRLRHAMRRRLPLVRDVVAASERADQRYQVNIGQKVFDIYSAQTVLFLTATGADLGPDALGNTIGGAAAGDQNLILEVLLEKIDTSDGGSTQVDNQLAAIWWVRSENLVWIQAFLEQRLSANGVSMVALHGSLFAFDPMSGAWGPATHSENCTCGRREVHEELRQVASAFVKVYLRTPEHLDVVISKQKYPVVTLFGMD